MRGIWIGETLAERRANSIARASGLSREDFDTGAFDGLPDIQGRERIALDYENRWADERLWCLASLLRTEIYSG
jgi:hypothetical protein